ncbi:MAG: Gfo/Idh/MocA family oxidoreductase [Clostridiales bacterium]|nr:Gfo/Idh/MocA family oxidoreductase [Clostridiales bacterium]
MKKHQIGLIGCGMISRSHIPAISMLENAELAAVCDVIAAKAEAAAQAARCRSFTDARSMLQAMPEIDVCLIATPTYTHAELVELCAEFGKAVLCEKPIAMTASQAARVRDVVAKSGIRYMTAMVVRFWSGYVILKEMMDAGVFGEIRMSYFSRCSQAQRWDNDWLYDPILGGGAMYDMLVHDVDFMNSLFGPAKNVYALASRDETNCYQNVFASIEYKGGARGVAETSFTMREGYPFSMYAKVMGSKATAEFSYQAGYSINDRQGACCSLKIWKDGQDPICMEPEQYNAYAKEIAYFLDCVDRGKRPEAVTLENSIEVMHVINAIEASAKLGQVIELDRFDGRL